LAAALIVTVAANVVLAGDFNDWRNKGDRSLTNALDLVEVFESVRGRSARTFPSMLPMFRLDRIYARGLKIVDIPFDPVELEVDLDLFRKVAPLVRPRLVAL